MRIAIVTLGIGDYWKACRTLFYSLEKYGMLPDTVERIMLYDSIKPPEGLDFARPVQIMEHYTDLPCIKRFINSFKRIFAFTLPYDRIIYLDADMLCIGDASLLWSEKIGKLPFYACRDTAAFKYYPDKLAAGAIDPQLVFNGGLEIYHPGLLPEFHDDLLLRLRSGTLSMYDGADQGALNSYFQFKNIEVGLLPQGLNYILDPFCPKLPEWEQRIIHFTNSGANPFKSPGRNDPETRKYYELWEEAWKECVK